MITTPAAVKICAAIAREISVGSAVEAIRIMQVTTRAMQKPNISAEKKKVWPRFLFSWYIAIWQPIFSVRNFFCRPNCELANGTRLTSAADEECQKDSGSGNVYSFLRLPT
jgi:hypothetical protein